MVFKAVPPSPLEAPHHLTLRAATRNELQYLCSTPQSPGLCSCPSFSLKHPLPAKSYLLLQTKADVSFSGKLLLDKVPAISYSTKLAQCFQSSILPSQDAIGVTAVPDERAPIAPLDEDCIRVARPILLAIWISDPLSQ